MNDRASKRGAYKDAGARTRLWHERMPCMAVRLGCESENCPDRARARAHAHGDVTARTCTPEVSNSEEKKDSRLEPRANRFRHREGTALGELKLGVRASSAQRMQRHLEVKAQFSMPGHAHLSHHVCSCCYRRTVALFGTIRRAKDRGRRSWPGREIPMPVGPRKAGLGSRKVKAFRSSPTALRLPLPGDLSDGRANQHSQHAIFRSAWKVNIASSFSPHS